MTYKLFLFTMLTCTFCTGQSVLTTPAESTKSVPVSTAAPSSSSAQTTDQVRQAADRTYIDGTISAPSPASARTRTVNPLTTQTDFERFAEESAGSPLPAYGRRLFDQVPTTFAPLDHVPVPADYVLGPGDELLIRAWGKIDLDSRVTIDRNGQIYLPRVGTVNVAGLKYDQLGGYLHSAVGALFKDFELNATLGQLRSIQIFVLGNARQPGAYTVGSLSTLVDALFASGGPSAIGSMRRIELRRGNKLFAEFDVYDLIQKGDKSRDIQLLPGDVIYIPSIGPQVAIAGSINEPGIYELKGDTTIAAALEGAGGLTSLAGAKRVVLERIRNHSSRRVEEFPLDEQGLRQQLTDGDLLRIYPLSPKFEDAVILRGNVAQPGRYAWKDGMRISDLIPSRESLITRNFWNAQNQLVPASANHEFGTVRTHELNSLSSGRSMTQPTDQTLNLRSNETLTQQHDAAIYQGSEQADPRSSQDERLLSVQINTSRLPLIETVAQNSTEINWEYAVIERLDDQDLSTRLIPFRLASAINDPASPDNQLLKVGDVVTIFSRADLELPIEKHASFVRVGGEVNAPGVYRVNPGETLRDVVVRAGGLTAHSYLYASILTRVSTRHAQEEQLRQSSEEMQRELISSYANATPQAGQGGVDQQAQLTLRQASMAALLSIKPIGRVVLQMKPKANTTVDIPDIALEDGDTFYIPPPLSTVQVTGAVYNANAFRHQPGKRIIAYLSDAGGATRQADQKRAFVIRADGTVISRQSPNSHGHGKFENLELLPGDALVIPEKLRISSKMNSILQATQFASQTAVTAAALSVIR